MQIIQFYFILAIFVTLSIIYFVTPKPQVIIENEYKSKCIST